VKVNVKWLDSEIFEAEDKSSYLHHLQNVSAILVPGGFGQRGSEGKIEAIRFAREHDVPYFGICFGMQMAVLETARSLAGLAGASSTEFGPCDEPVIGLMTEWVAGNEVKTRKDDDDKGGTMRLGAYPCTLTPGSLAETVYAQEHIEERHRHRYEVNIAYREKLEAAGLKMSGLSPDGVLPEIVEREDHPWFVAVQFHPELKSKPFSPHPLFVGFVAAAREKSRLV